jgi:hypothetical protein
LSPPVYGNHVHFSDFYSLDKNSCYRACRRSNNVADQFFAAIQYMAPVLFMPGAVYFTLACPPGAGSDFRIQNYL